MKRHLVSFFLISAFILNFVSVNVEAHPQGRGIISEESSKPPPKPPPELPSKPPRDDDNCDKPPPPTPPGKDCDKPAGSTD